MCIHVWSRAVERWSEVGWRLRSVPVAVRLLGPISLAWFGAAALGFGLARTSESSGPWVILGTVGTFGGLLLGALVLERTVLAPLRRTRRTAERLAARELDSRARVTAGDVVGQLGTAVNRTADTLQAFHDETRDQHRTNRLLLGRLVNSQEAERSALARELHDGPVQTLLAATQVLVGSDGSGPDREEREQIHGRLRNVIDDLRRISQGVRPVTLDTLGIERALGRHVEDVRLTSGVEIDYECASPESATRLPEPTELAMFRTVQEALSNVVRHAKATHASVVFVRTRRQLSVVIEDDGCGFTPSELDGESIGLCHMQERAALVGGSCDILSAPGRGTIVRIRAPVEQAGGA